MKDKGIQHEKTVTKTPEHNGDTERLNRTLVESARSMLMDASLSKCYWAEAISTAVYLKNCCPTQRLYQGRHLMKQGMERSQGLTTFECLGVMRTPMFPKMNEENLTRKQESAFYLVMVKKRKAADSTISLKSKIFHSRDLQFNEKFKDMKQTSPSAQDEDYRLVINISNDIEIEAESEDEQPNDEESKAT